MEKGNVIKEYHENGNIKEETEVNSEGVRHGIKKIYHENGQLQVQVEYTNGKQNDGEIISFHDNGNKARCVNLLDGNFEGDFIEWHKNGIISRKGVYENHEIVEEQLWDEDNNPIDKMSKTPFKKIKHFKEIEIPVYKNIIVGLKPIYDGEKCLELGNPFEYINVPLLFQEEESKLYYVLIPVESQSNGMEIIDYIIKENTGKKFKKELENEYFNYMFSSKFFYIGFMKQHSCVRINTLYNLKDINSL